MGNIRGKLELAADEPWEQQLRRLGYQKAKVGKNAWVKEFGDLGNGHPSVKAQVRKTGGMSGFPEQLQVTVQGFGIDTNSGRVVGVGTADPEDYANFEQAFKYLRSLNISLERK